ncbi:MAG TPA: hypothetical protein ENF87_02560 [Thermoproteales archaeon]|nr:hypothetical protein [Thermoproteales archaeon]
MIKIQGIVLLKDIERNVVYSNMPYSYRICKESENVKIANHKVIEGKGFKEVVLNVLIGDVEVFHNLIIPNEGCFFDERIKIVNKLDKVLNGRNIGMGFVLKDGYSFRFTPISFRRDAITGEIVEYTFDDFFTKKGYNKIIRGERRKINWREETKAFGADGWVINNGRCGLVVAKYSQEYMEFSLIEPLAKGVICFGGCGVWKDSDPEKVLEIKPGEAFTFGQTRYIFYDGGWKEGFYFFRDFMRSKGHRIPQNYDPPIHWNELYDNPLWWIGDSAENRRKYYTREHMIEEAEKARELGCEALYLDPGWDTNMGSSIWDEERLGPQKEFSKFLVRKVWFETGITYSSC